MLKKSFQDSNGHDRLWQTSSVCQEGVTSDSKTTALLQAKAQHKNISLKSLAPTRTVFHLRSKQCDT